MICLSLLASVRTLSAHEDIAHIQDIENLIYAFKLDRAESLLSNSENVAQQAFYRFHITTYKYLSAQSDAHFTEMKSQWKDLLEALEAQDNADPFKEVMLAEVYGKRAVVEFLQKNYLTSLWNLKKCRSHIKKQEKSFPKHASSLKIRGIFNVIFGAVPKKYQWITNALGYRGNVDLGISQLNQAVTKSKLLILESNLVYFLVLKNFKQDSDKAINNLVSLKKSIGESIVIDYCLASAYLSVKKNDKAYQILQGRNKYLNDKAVTYIPLWDFQMGRSLYFKSKYSNAQYYFNSFLLKQQGDIFRSDAIFRLGMSHLLSGDYSEGRKYFQQLVSNTGSDFDEDIYASYMANEFLVNKPSHITQQLFRARNAYDGGYYQIALEILDELKAQSDILDPQQLIQLYYIYGRIYHSIGQLNDSRSNYLKCISLPAKKGTKWNQAYAYFYLAEIEKQEGNKTMAISYYKQALNKEDYFYQSGLENRCKVSLKSLEKAK